MKRNRTRYGLAALLLACCGGCCGGLIRVEAIDGLVARVATRHDNYVTADGTLTANQRETYLRSTDLLLRLIEEAKK